MPSGPRSPQALQNRIIVKGKKMAPHVPDEPEVMEDDSEASESFADEQEVIIDTMENIEEIKESTKQNVEPPKPKKSKLAQELSDCVVYFQSKHVKTLPFKEGTLD
jgi:hypothetical protein